MQDPVRRPLTAVFIDLVGSTPLSSVMGEEAFALLLDEYRRAVDELVEQHGGFIAKDEGDGRFIWFGWPAARRDDADRAVAFALDVMPAIAELSSPVEASTGRTLAIRIGIHSGSAIIAPDEREATSVSGPTINLAAKIQQAAEPGSVLISEATLAALRHGVDLADHESLVVDSLEGSIGVHEVIRVVGDPSVSHSLVGRDVEIARLRDGWHTTQTGGSAALLVVGPAGIGKSMLVESFAEEAGVVATVRIQGEADLGALPLRALQPALRPLVGDGVDSEPLAALGVEPEVATDALRAAGRIPLEGRTTEVVAAAVEVIRAAASLEPLLLFVDDAHWLDPSTAEVVGTLVTEECPGLMVVATSRNDLSGPAWASVETSRLRGLDERESQSLLGQLGEGDGETRREIIERAAGNPFFLVWLDRTRRDGRYEGVRTLLRPRSGVPSIVQQAVRGQIDEAGVEDRVTSTAAVIGMTFDVELLAAVLDRTRTELESELDRLTKVDILRPDPEDANRRRFSHSLVRDLARDLLLAPALKETHGRVADTLVAQRSDDHALLGLHHDRAGRPLQACEANLLAAHDCERSSAYREGAALADRVLELAADEANEIPAPLVSEARALRGKFAASILPDSYVGATTDRLGGADSEDDPRRTAMDKTRDWAGAMMGGDLRASIRILYEVRQMAKHDVPELRQGNQNARGIHAWYRGRYALAERLIEASTADARENGIDPWLVENWATPDDPVTMQHSFAPSVLHQRGRGETARWFEARTWNLAEAVPGGGHTMAHAGQNLAVFWEMAGDAEEALRVSRQTEAIGEELGLDFWTFSGAHHARMAQSILEPTTELVELLEADAALFAALAPVAAGRIYLQLAKSWIRLGEPGRALTALDSLRTTIDTLGIQMLDAEERRLRALLGDPAERADRLVDAATVARRQGARRYRLAALCDLAEHDAEADVDGRTVVEELGDAVVDFPEPEGDPDIDRARSILDSLAG